MSPTVTAAAVLAAFMMLAGCASQKATPAETGANSLEALAWLSGSWSGEHDGGIIQEHWTLPTGGMMVGMSKLVIDDKAVFFEYLRIVRNSDGTIDYIAQPAGKPPVKFRLTSSGPDTATFENPEHDDPKLIRYRRQGQHLQAATEGQAADGSRNIHPVDMQRSRLPR
jgi:hypothetical protein